MFHPFVQKLLQEWGLFQLFPSTASNRSRLGHGYYAEGKKGKRRELISYLLVKGREQSLCLKMLPSWQNKINNYNEAKEVLQIDSTRNGYHPLSVESVPDGRVVPAQSDRRICRISPSHELRKK